MGVLVVPTVKHLRYKPFGESLEGGEDEVGYTGHKFDSDSGLNYMQARYYDPVIGRFYSNDPVDFMGHVGAGDLVHGFNRYTYVANNPYKYIDPSGQIKIAIGASAELAFLGGAKVSFKASYDTETMELAGTVAGGPRLGLAAGVVWEGGLSESSSTPATNGTDSNVKVTMDASAGPITMSKDLMSQKPDGTVSSSGKGTGEMSTGVDAVKLKPSLKVGATVGVEFSGTATTSIVKDTVETIKDVFKDTDE